MEAGAALAEHALPNPVVKVLQLISSGGMYGAENMVLQLVGALKRQPGCQPVVGVIENKANPHRELAEACTAIGVDTVILPCRSRLDQGTIAQLRGILREEQYNILHTHGYKANIYARAAAHGWGGALVATCHNWPGRSLQMRAYAALDRLLLRGFDRIVAVSDEVKEKIPGSGAGDGRVRVIRNGIALEQFIPIQITRSRDPSGRLWRDTAVIGYVGRLTDDKGVRVLLEAAEKVHEHFPDVRFLLVGDGPQRAEYEARFASPHVLFSGFRKDAFRCYGCMDVFALPSFAEGLPMAVLEAMASSLPVVATKVGQIPDLVKNGSTGYLVEPGNRDRLAEALCRLLENPELATRMGEHGRAQVADRYSADMMAEGYWGVYQEALN